MSWNFAYSDLAMSLGYGGITVLLNFVYLFGWHQLLITKYEHKWTVGKELLSTLVHVIFIGIANGVFSFLAMRGEVGLSVFGIIGFYILFTLAVGFIPVSFLLVFSELELSNRYTKQSKDLLQNKVIANQSIIVEVTNDREDLFLIDSQYFRFARAAGNYVEIYTVGDNLQKKLYRITLSNLEGILIEGGLNVMRTHRSFIISLDHVIDVEGNAQGYSLGLTDIEEKLPVARNKIPDFTRLMNGK